MKEIIIIAVCIGLVMFFIIKVRKLKNHSESKLSVFEHPSTFKKPPIEMVSSNTKEENQSDSFIIQEIENDKNG